MTRTAFVTNHADNSGGALFLNGLRQLTATDNSADAWAGAVYVGNGTSLNFTGDSFNGNTANGPGGALVTDSDGTVTLDGVTCADNTAAGHGGAFRAWSTSSVTIASSHFLRNHTDDSGGGAIIGAADDVTITQTEFRDNSAQWDAGGLYLHSTRAASVTGCTLATNQTGRWIGGLYVYQTTADIAGCTIEGNRAGSDGGGLYGSAGAVLTVTDTRIRANHTDGTAGGFGLWSSSATVRTSTIQDNTADYQGGGAAVRGNSHAAFDRVTFQNNTATNSDGGAITVQDSTLTMTGGTLTGNRTPGYGGGIDLWNSTGTVAGNQITGNTGHQGVAVTVRNHSAAQIDGNQMRDNRTTGTDGRGAIFVFDQSHATVTNNTITRNAEAGVWADWVQNTVVSDNTISGNGGAGIAVVGDSSLVTLRRNLSWSNQGLGIDLGNDGVTLNDQGDLDTGPNGRLNFPVLRRDAGAPPGQVRLAGTAGPNQTIDLFRAEAGPVHGGAVAYLGPATTDGSGAFSLDVPTFDDWATATATDASGATSEFALNIPPMNVPPKLQPIPDQTVHQGELLSLVVWAIDGNTPPDAVTYALTGAVPAGMALDPTTGLLTWRPTAAQPTGDYPVTVVAADTGVPPLSDQATITITVEPPLAVPSAGVFAVPAAYLSHDGGAGLLGSYVNQSLGGASAPDDWRATQTLAGTRADPVVNFATTNWGRRRDLGITGGPSDADWDNFSVQWDGYLTVPTAGTRVYLRATDAARLWIDVNGDGVFDGAAPEFLDDHWGQAGAHYNDTDQWLPGTAALAAGTYRIRVQYDARYGPNEMTLAWDDAANSAGLIAATGTIAHAGDIQTFTLDLTAGDTLTAQPRGGLSWDRVYSRGLEILAPDGSVLASSFTGTPLVFVVPTTGNYTARVSARFMMGSSTGDYKMMFHAAPFAGVPETLPDDAGDPGTALTAPTSFRGTLRAADDLDTFTFSAAAGDAVALRFAGVLSANPALRLYDPVGNLVAAGLDGAGVSAVLSVAGTYRVVVSADHAGAVVTGTYFGNLAITNHAVAFGPGACGFDQATALEPILLHVVPREWLHQDLTGPPGLAGSYVNQNLRWRLTQDDWRQSLTIAGTRVDGPLQFTGGWGPRAAVGLTGGSDANWENFSVQWDGWITIPDNGTRLYLRTDDGARMWMDLNGDGVFDSAGPELVDNLWGQGHGALTSAGSVPLAAGMYRVRIQFEQGGGGNEMDLLWDEPAGRGATVPAQVVGAVGQLTDLHQSAAFAVDLAAGQGYEFHLLDTPGGLGVQERLLTIYNDLGQPITAAVGGSVSISPPAVRTGRYFVVVQALGPLGLGAFALSGSWQWTFSTERDNPIYYFDFVGADGSHAPFSPTSMIPMIVGEFEAVYGVYNAQTTLIKPADGTEYVTIGVGHYPDLGGGVGGGWWGSRRPSGGAACNVDPSDGATGIADLAWAYRVTRHEAGHGTGLPHLSHPMDTMSYDPQVDLFPVSQDYPWGDHPVPGRSIFRARDYLDWATQPGRITAEVEPNDRTPQNLDPYFAEMAADSDPVNDRVVVIGSLATLDDVDDFTFTVTTPETYTFDVDSAEFQDPLDAALLLLDSQGQQVAFSAGGIDRDTGLESVDPSLMYRFPAPGTYRVRLLAATGTCGNYRLKITPQHAWDPAGPRILATWPDGGASLDSTRQIVLWTNHLLDPATLTAANVQVRGAVTGLHPGTVNVDPLDATVTWLADAPLPPDAYTLTLVGGPGGVTDLHGNLLDGETGGVLAWPAVAGDGAPGGDFVTAFTITAPDDTPAALSWASARRHSYNYEEFDLYFTDDMDIPSLYTSPLTLRRAGPDGWFDTADDELFPVDRLVNRLTATRTPHLMLYTRGVPGFGAYRVDGQALDAAGHPVPFTYTFSLTSEAVPAAYLSHAPGGAPGLVGTYIDHTLRWDPPQDDWRTSQVVAGTRIDRQLNFTSATWGNRADVGLTNGSDANWENFSTQWDGFVTIPHDGVSLYTRSDDGSRMWIDLDHDGQFEPGELVDNGWGQGHGATTGPASAPLAAGQYAIRIQYEQGWGGSEMDLLWDDEASYLADGGQTRAPSVVELNVKAGSVVTAPLDNVTVTFSDRVDPATLTPASFRLRWSADPTFFDGNDVALTDSGGVLAWDPALHRATFRPAAPLADGYYLLELSGQPGGIADPLGRLLDGEYLDSGITGNALPSTWAWTPSGDNVPGGDYRAAFEVRHAAALPPQVTGAITNAQPGQDVGSIDGGSAGLRTIAVTLSQPVQFRPADVQVRAVHWAGTQAVVDRIITPVAVTGSGTPTMIVTLPAGVTNTWLQVTLASAGVTDLSGRTLDGEPRPGGSGRGYLYAAADLPSGDGVAGGDAVFYVGSLPGDTNGDGSVDGADLRAVATELGSAPGPSGADLDRNGVVDLLDLAHLARQYGQALDAGGALGAEPHLVLAPTSGTMASAPQAAPKPGTEADAAAKATVSALSLLSSACAPRRAAPAFLLHGHQPPGTGAAPGTAPVPWIVWSPPAPPLPARAGTAAPPSWRGSNPGLVVLTASAVSLGVPGFPGRGMIGQEDEEPSWRLGLARSSDDADNPL